MTGSEATNTPVRVFISWAKMRGFRVLLLFDGSCCHCDSDCDCDCGEDFDDGVILMTIILYAVRSL